MRGRDSSDCPFCFEIENLDSLRPGSGQAISFPDAHPVSNGHLLVVPRRHVERIEELEDSDWLDLFALVRQEMQRLDSKADVQGVNLGVNSGSAAGQTVAHAHVHLIPRREGDCENPRGGVRQVLDPSAGDWERSASA